MRIPDWIKEKFIPLVGAIGGYYGRSLIRLGKVDVQADPGAVSEDPKLTITSQVFGMPYQQVQMEFEGYDKFYDTAVLVATVAGLLAIAFIVDQIEDLLN